MLIDREDPLPCADPALVDDWHGVAYSAELTPGTLVPCRLLGQDLVLWRDDDGVAHAWDDRCPHRGASLAHGCVVAGTVECPYHGWRYDGSAACVLIPAAPSQAPPARARATEFRLEERYGLIWVSLGDPARDVPEFPEWSDPTFRGFNVGPYAWDASGYRAVENFIDATHFPFVHPDVNGVPEDPDLIRDYEVTEIEGGFATSEIPVYQPYGDHRDVPVLAGYSYKVLRPLVAYFSKRLLVADGLTRHPEDWDPQEHFCTLLVVHQVDETHCIVRIALAINYGPELTQADIARRQDLVYAQDKAIVEIQRPRRIPTDVRAEIHHRTDKAGIAYRRYLADLKVEYGTIPA